LIWFKVQGKLQVINLHIVSKDSQRFDGPSLAAAFACHDTPIYDKLKAQDPEK
jgi:hypothetical protein